MNDEIEEWRPVVGHEGAYEVSSHGRVKSLARHVRRVSKRGLEGTRLTAERILAPGQHTSGYVQAHLYVGQRQRIPRLVHALVLEAFVGPRPPGQEALHGDHNRQNNRLPNLRWGTKRENEDDKMAAGRASKGETHRSAKLTAKDVAAIRRRRGEEQQPLADEFGCTFSNISAIQLRKSWRHV